MRWAVLSYAFVVGMAATVNPCGAAMLPAYLTWFTRSEPGKQVPVSVRVPRAVVAGLAATAGFVVVFAVVGAAVSAGLGAVMSATPYAGIAVGAALITLGALSVSGRHVTLRLPGSSRNLGGGGGGPRAMAGFGVSYALASLGCALPVFLAGVAGAFTRSGVGAGIAAFVAFALGMGAVLTALAVALAVAPRSRLRAVRSLGSRLERPTGLLLALVGAYLIYYWVADLTGAQSAVGAIGAVDGVASTLASALGSAGPLLGLGLVGAVAIVVFLTAFWGGGRRHHGGPRAGDPAPTTRSGGVVATRDAVGALVEPAAPSPSAALPSAVPALRSSAAPPSAVPALRSSAAIPARREPLLAGHPRVRRASPFLAVGLVAGLLAGVVGVGVLGGGGSSPDAAAGGATASAWAARGASPRIQRLVALDPIPGSQRTAPFTLIDQQGHPESLSSLRGKAVLLSFNDNHCTQLCPLYAADVRAAVSDLGPLAHRVAFVAINVNPFYPGVAYDVAFDREHGLANVPEWHYLTGSLPELRAVWSAYGATPTIGPDHVVEHAPTIELIGPSGHLRGIADYGPSSADASLWGHALATLAQALLGTHARLPSLDVSAPPTPTTAAPGFSMHLLGGAPGTRVSLAALRGHPVVLNFFASWCSACKAEAPGLGAAARRLPAGVRLVGVDVADSIGPAEAFVRRYRLPYPVGEDPEGNVAGLYGITGLPTTIFISASGQIVDRHVGEISPTTLTTEAAHLLGRG
ncbi:MAG: redoxin domain-containing protein [Actinomycetota bacterium]|nr:redoxin domain-containing protein [Actinomycetota bacterium]